MSGTSIIAQIFVPLKCSRSAQIHFMNVKLDKYLRSAIIIFDVDITTYVISDKHPSCEIFYWYQIFALDFNVAKQ